MNTFNISYALDGNIFSREILSLSFICPLSFFHFSCLYFLSQTPHTKTCTATTVSFVHRTLDSTCLWKPWKPSTVAVREVLGGRDESDSLKTVIIDNYTPTKDFLSLFIPPFHSHPVTVQLQLGTIKSRSSNMVVFCHVSVFNTTSNINSTNTHNESSNSILTGSSTD